MLMRILQNSSKHNAKASAVVTKTFQRLVQGLKDQGKTCTIVESSCGGLLNASLMAIPGSSAVYYGGTIAYNTQQSKKLLLNDDALHQQLLQRRPPRPPSEQAEQHVDSSSSSNNHNNPQVQAYIQSKRDWTKHVALAYCQQLNVDYAIAEAGAMGPTFRPPGLTTGFTVVTLVGKDSVSGHSQLLAQSTLYSTHAHRLDNMEHFTEAAADWAANVMGIPKLTPEQDEKVQQDAKPYVDQQPEQPKQQHKQQDEEEDCPPLSLDRASHLRKE